jgi:hypothetical protein
MTKTMTEHKQPDWTELEAAARKGRETFISPEAWLIEWTGDDGRPRSRIDRDGTRMEPWLESFKPKRTPLYPADSINAMVAAAEARASTAEARVVELEGALKPFANFRLEGFDGEVLEVVPSSPMNPASRIEPVWAGYFRKARAALLSPPPGEEGGRGSSGAERAGAPACGAATAAHSQSEGGAS